MDEEQIWRLCMLAGNQLLRYGAETSRIEETITHFAVSAGIQAEHVQCFVTPTGIFVSMSTATGTTTRLARVTGSRILDLDKVTQINSLSRQLQSGECSINDAIDQLEQIDNAPLLYSLPVQIVAAALSSGSFTIILGGKGTDFIYGAIGGILAQELTRWTVRFVPRFFAVLLASLVGSLFAVLISVLGFSHHEGVIIIGAILPLLPGLAVTNSIRDLLAGDLLAGVARGAEALFTAAAIAVAVALAISLST